MAKINNNQRFAMSSIAAGLFLLLVAASAESANAAALNYSVDTNLSVGSKTYVIKSGSSATSLAVSSTGFTVTTGTGETMTIESADRFNYNFAGSNLIATTCTSDLDRVVISPGVTGATITPDTATTCTVPVTASSGGSGGASFGIGSGPGGGSSASPSPTPPPPTPPTPPTPSPSPVTSPPPPPVTPPPASGSSALSGVGTVAIGLRVFDGSQFTLTSDLIDSSSVSEGDDIEGGSSAKAAAAVHLKANTRAEARALTNLQARKIITAKTPASTKNAVKNFVAYGTKTTASLGEVERVNVVNSFDTAFGKAPTTKADWHDVIRIADGVTPKQKSKTAEATAKKDFANLYNRAAKAGDKADQKALDIMAYGVTTKPHDLAAETSAKATFKAEFGKAPTTAKDWNAVRALVDSGAKPAAPAKPAAKPAARPAARPASKPLFTPGLR